MVDKKDKQPGLWDRLWQALIRPPRRVQYNITDLGPNYFIYENTLARRCDFEVINSRGHKLMCSYFEPLCLYNMPHPAIIYLHGNASSRLEGMMLLEHTISNNISLILMDFSGCGISEGEYISLGYYERIDASQVIDYVKEKWPITKIGIWGRSMGAVTAILTSINRNDIEYVVADSPFMNIKMLYQEVAKKQYKVPKMINSMAYYFIRKKIKKVANFELNDLDIVKLVSESKHRPNILFLHAKNDELIHYRHSKTIMEAYPGPKNLIIFEGNHNSKRSNNVQKQVTQFFKYGLQVNKVEKRPDQSTKTFKQYQHNIQTTEQNKQSNDMTQNNLESHQGDDQLKDTESTILCQQKRQRIQDYKLDRPQVNDGDFMPDFEEDESQSKNNQSDLDDQISIVDEKQSERLLTEQYDQFEEEKSISKSNINHYKNSQLRLCSFTENREFVDLTGNNPIQTPNLSSKKFSVIENRPPVLTLENIAKSMRNIENIYFPIENLDENQIKKETAHMNSDLQKLLDQDVSNKNDPDFPQQYSKDSAINDQTLNTPLNSSTHVSQIDLINKKGKDKH